MRSFARTIVLSAAIAAIPFLIPGSASAAIWTGATNSDWATGTNWDSGSWPSDGTATFATKGSIVDPYLSNSYTIWDLSFTGTGWNIRHGGGRTLNLRGINLSATNATAGIGTNVKLLSDVGVTVASGSVLTIGDQVFFNNQRMTKDGTGTLVLNGSGNTDNSSVRYFTVNGGTVLINGNNYSGGTSGRSLTVASSATLGGRGQVGANGTNVVPVSI